jgi:uncharacterized protein YdhG (YjbR/CyaY superfamily)
MVKRISPSSKSDGVDAYIASCPADVRGKLKEIRAAIKQAAPGVTETTSYFQIPGYSYPGYDYNGMFAWFDLQKSYINLRIRPPAIEGYRKDLERYARTKSVVRFPLDQKIPVPLVKKLVKASVRVMKERSARRAPKTRA